MKLMVVGGGGREHAIIKKLNENKDVEVIYALPGNGGMADDAVCTGIGATDIPAIVKGTFLLDGGYRQLTPAEVADILRESL